MDSLEARHMEAIGKIVSMRAQVGEKTLALEDLLLGNPVPKGIITDYQGLDQQGVVDALLRLRQREQELTDDLRRMA